MITTPSKVPPDWRHTTRRSHFANYPPGKSWLHYVEGGIWGFVFFLQGIEEFFGLLRQAPDD